MFIVYWYGRAPAERDVLELIMFGPYKAIFALSMILNFGIPLTCLIWNPIRKSILGPTIIGLSVVTGNLVDRIRIYVSSFSIPDSLGSELHGAIPATHYPDVADILMIVGAISGGILIYLLATRIIPIFSAWEMKELSLLRKVRTYLRREVVVLGKPD
jgi:Ni/Fe-hydrogenase subunit HybB-like protein